MNRKAKVKKDAVVEGAKQRGQGLGHLHKTNGNGDIPKTAKGASSASDVRDLEEHAKAAYVLLMDTEHQLMDTEHQRTANYWDLGNFLRDIRRQLGLAHGAWMKYLESMRIDYEIAKRACRLRGKHDNRDQCKNLTLREALDYKPSESVKEAKQAQAKAKRAAQQSKSGNSPLPVSQQKPPTDEEKQALKIFLEACGTLERARFVLDTVVTNA